MGLEASCVGRLGRKASPGKALLETETLVFRGDFRVELPLERLEEVRVDGQALVVRAPEHELRLELGAAVAQKWARAIREPKGLFDKLDLNPETRAAVVGIDEAAFLASLPEHVAAVTTGRVPQGVDVVFFGVESRAALGKAPLLRARIRDTGALWVVRPKKSKTITEADILSSVRAAGFVDTKVVAFSRTHTAHKFVVPVHERGHTPRPRRAFVTLAPPPDPVVDGARTDDDTVKPRRPAKRRAATPQGE